MKGYSFRVTFLASVLLLLLSLIQQIDSYNAERVRSWTVKGGGGGGGGGGGTEPSSSMPKKARNDFVFPDELERRQSSLGPPTVCEGSTFCENSRDYPEDFVNRAIERNDSLKLLQNEDTLSSVIQRMELSGLSGDVPLCVSKEEIVYPTSAENKNREWLHVVNQRNFKQGLRIESCSEEEKNCNLIGGVAHGHRTICKQKYVYRQLVAISSDGSVLPDFFRFPSCCCCHAELDIFSSIRIRAFKNKNDYE